MSAIGESAKFIDKELVPSPFSQFDCERIGLDLLADLFRLDRHPVVLQKTGEIVRLELAGDPEILRNSDTDLVAPSQIAVV